MSKTDKTVNLIKTPALILTNLIKIDICRHTAFIKADIMVDIEKSLVYLFI